MYDVMYGVTSVEVVVAPPSCYLSYVRENLPNAIGISAQNCYKAEKGAFTGEIRYVNCNWWEISG